MNKTSEIKIGDFIEIPAWKTVGRVINKRDANYGDDSAVRIQLAEDPDELVVREYQLEDGQFINQYQ